MHRICLFTYVTRGLIGHFRVPKILIFKTRLCTKLFQWNEFYMHENKKSFSYQCRRNYLCLETEAWVALKWSIREFKIQRLRTTATDKYATAHDQNHMTVHFSHVVLRLRWVVELFRVVGTTENVLLVFCRLGNSRISSFRKKVFNSPALSEREAKYVSCV